MKSYPEDLCTVAERVLWFETAEEALRFPKRFLAYLMTRGTVEEILVARKYYSARDFESVLEDPPTGIFDPQSWNYWNLVFKRNPVPSLPERVIPNG